MGKPFALDWGAILLATDALGLDAALVADLLPCIESAVIGAINSDGDGADNDLEWEGEASDV